MNIILLENKRGNNTSNELVSLPDVEKSPTKEKPRNSLKPGKSLLKKIDSHPDPEWVVDGVELTNIHKPIRSSPYSHCGSQEGPAKRCRSIRARTQDNFVIKAQKKKGTENDLLKIIKIRK